MGISSDLQEGEPKPNALELIREDHTKVKDLFKQFEEAQDTDTKKSVSEEAMKELKVHAAMEEELFYPTVNQNVDADELVDMAEEEHHIVKILISELEDMDIEDERFDAKFKVLAENVRHHIQEEETKIFPEMEQADIDLESLAQQMSARKKELMEEGVPASGRKSASQKKRRTKKRAA